MVFGLTPFTEKVKIVNAERIKRKNYKLTCRNRALVERVKKLEEENARLIRKEQEDV